MWVRQPFFPRELLQRRRRAFGYKTLADGASWRENLNTGTTANTAGGNVDMRLRIQINLAAGDTADQSFKFRYSHNSGAYTDITAASTHIQTFDTTYYADGDTVEPQLLGTASPFIQAAAAEDSTGTFTVSGNILANDTFETEIALRVIAAAVSDTDTIDIRVYKSDNTALDTYTVTPRITINASASTIPVFYHHYRTMAGS